jgi:nitrogen-specific signal transduction histidine kinase
VVLVFRDITEKQKTLEALQRTDKLNSLGVLAGGIAHDFNNLLAGIFGYVSLAKIVGQKTPETVKYLDKALSVFDRAKGLSHQLLTFSSGGLPTRKTGNLGTLIRTSVNFAGSGSNIIFDVDIAEDLRLCDFDQGQLDQVLDNLIINARQAMPEGGRLRLKAFNIDVAEAAVSELKPGPYIKLSLSDEGEGIPFFLQSRIFDPFFTTKPAGQGLGLATCRSIVQKHDGAMDFESEPGRGTTFHIYLPASAGNITTEMTPPARDHRGHGTILVMDDEEFIREIMSEEMQAMGYVVVTVKNGAEAIEHMGTDQARRPRAVFLDLTIPGALGGKETARILRKSHPDLPIIASSGFSNDPVIARPLDYGFTGSLRKPFDRAELSSILNRFLD